MDCLGRKDGELLAEVTCVLFYLCDKLSRISVVSTFLTDDHVFLIAVCGHWYNTCDCMGVMGDSANDHESRATGTEKPEIQILAVFLVKILCFYNVGQAGWP